MRRFWIFNHYATTPLTGPLLRHFYFAEYLKEKGIETTVFAANELHPVSYTHLDLYKRQAP